MKINKRQFIRSITMIGGLVVALTCSAQYGAEVQRDTTINLLNNMELYDKDGKLLKF